MRTSASKRAAFGRALWIVVLVLAFADGAEAKNAPAKVTVSGPGSVLAGSTATFTVNVRATRTLKRGTVTLQLSTDRKSDRKDTKLATANVRKTKKGKTAKVQMRAKVSAVTAAKTYYALACLTVGKDVRCVAKKLQVKAASRPAPPATTVPTPVAPVPQPSQPQPTATATPPGTDPAPIVINTPAPAPGPTDAPAADPATVTAPLPSESAASIKSSTSFLYTGASPIQKGVASTTIKLARAAVLRGTVANRFGGGIGGVRVSVADHPELGTTSTRADGGYDMAVNGGGRLTLVFERDGYISGQRTVDAPWQDYADVDPLVLVPYDTRGTQIDTGGNGVSAAQATPINDGLGARTQTLLFEPGTTAQIVVGGVTRDLGDSFTVRSTEFTQGPGGLDAMPGQLPPTTAYTYAAEFSLDEAVAAGASDVRFSKPVVTYLDNFLKLPVGVPVPAGYYDRERNTWVGAPNGRVVKVLANGAVDTDGDGAADNAGIDAAEQARLASLYAAGTELWRVEVTHFTPWDYNYPYGPADDAHPPGPDVGPDDPNTPPCDPCKDEGSILLSEEQILGEQLPVAGVDAMLSYRSDDVPGRTAERRVRVKLVDGALPASLMAVNLTVSVAGRTTRQRFTAAQAAAAPNYLYIWDGRDAYGRAVQGTAVATVEVGYEYRAVYKRPEEFGSSWARLSRTPIGGSPSRGNFTLSRTDTVALAAFDARGVGLGGWALTDHHRYDPVSRVLRLGSGEFSGIEATRLGVLEALPATGVDSPTALALDATGALWIADTRGNRIRRRALDGTLTTVAGSGAYGYRPTDDGAAASTARLSSPEGIAVAPASGDAQIAYLADTGAHRVRRIAADGTITTVAGGGTALGDNGPAADARLSSPTGLAVGPDGSLYIADTGQHRVRMVGTDGTITTVAGTGAAGLNGDGGAAAAAQLDAPSGLAFDRDGALLIADTGNARVRRVDIDGTIRTVAGGGTPADGLGDGGLGTNARLREPLGLAVGRDGRVLIADALAGRVRALTAAGTISTVAGGGTEARTAGVPSTATALSAPTGVVVAPDGKLIFSEPPADRIAGVQQPRPGFSEGDALIASADGAQIFQFNLNGRHERTLDALTGAVVRRFEYDADGRLARVFDEAAGEAPPHSALLTIERSTPGTITLTTQGGRVTRLDLDAQGWVSRVTNPAGEIHRLTHGANGLLTGEEDAEGGKHSFGYDAVGRLASDTNPVGVTKTLTRTDFEQGREVKLTEPGGVVTTYRGELDDEGTYTRTVTDPSGAKAVTRRTSDGTVRSTYENGMVITSRLAPDPRFGLQAPYLAKQVVTTPNGRSRTYTATRTATIRAADPSRIDRQVETIVDEGATSTSTFVAAPGNAGGTLTTVAPSGQTGTVTLDRRGRPVATKTTAGATTATYGYDDAHDGRTSAQAQGARAWTFGYDARNRITSRTDGTGAVTTYTYDDADRQLTTTTSGQTWKFSYDHVGRRTGVESPSGRTSSSTQDAAGKVATMTLPGTAPYQRAYTALEQIDTHTLPSGATTSSTYEAPAAGGRATGRTDRRSAAGAPVTSTTLGYFGATDQPSATTWTAGARSQTLTSEYDGAVPTKITFGGQAQGSISTPLTANGLQADEMTIAAGAGAPVTYDLTYDSSRRITRYGPFTIARNATTGIAETYTDATDATELRNRALTGFGELDERRVSESGTVRYALDLARDATGRVTRREETLAGGAPIVRAYEYDARGRLTTVRDGGGTTVESYAYNADDDRTSANGETAAYNATTFRQTAAGPLSLAFDADGYMTARGSDTFTYGPSGELLSAQVGATTVTYSYDALGRLTHRAAGASRTSYLYGNPQDVLQLTATTDEAGVLTTYFYDDFDQLHAIERAGTRFRIGADQVGTPRVVIDGAGTVVKQIDRDSYGRITGDSAPGFALALGFAGGIEDSATGLVRFGMRDYDPRTGRWTAQDPLFFAGGQGNLYAYAQNQPATRHDPSGLLSFGISGYLGFGGGVSLQIGKDGWSTCGEAGVGIGGGAEADVMSGADDGLSAVAEAQLRGATLGVTVSAEATDCPEDNIKLNTKVSIKASLIAAQGSYNFKDGFNGGWSPPPIGIKAEAKHAYKYCKKWSYPWDW